MADNLVTVTLPAKLSARVLAWEAESPELNHEDVIKLAMDALEGECGWPLEPWELTEIRESLAELDRDPSAVFTSEQVRQHLEAELQRLLAEETQDLQKAG